MTTISRRTRYVLGFLLIAMVCVAATILMVSAAPTTSAAITGSTKLALDFTKPEEVKAKAKWSEPEKVAPSKEGLVWDGDFNRSREVWIESTPVAVGLSWRPATGVSIEAEVVYGRKWPFNESEWPFPVGELYARYSPDRRHWSSWQYLEGQGTGIRKRPSHTYKGVLKVPSCEHKPYGKFVSKYSTMDVPWRSDEEAVVRWILENDPRFFEKHLPFVGYVQFLFETRLSPRFSLKNLTARICYMVGGGHAPPKDKSVYEERTGPWRFVAPETAPRGQAP